MKSTPFLIAALFIASLLPSLARPKIATVAMDKIFAEYYLTKKLSEDQQKALEELDKNPRMTALVEMSNELKTMSEKLKNLEPQSEDFNNLLTEIRERDGAIKALNAEWNQFRNEEGTKLTEKLIADLDKEILTISKVIEQLGKDGKFDWIVETSGKTSTQIPVILYVRDATDLTQTVIDIINKDADKTE